MASAALHAMERSNAEFDAELGALVAQTQLYGDAVALAWAAIALGPAIQTIRISRQ